MPFNFKTVRAMTIPIPPGVFDLLPLDADDAWRETHLWNYVEGVCRRTAMEYGFQEIRTPMFERIELFKRGVGEGTDIVSKEMYTFEDRGGRHLALRPEGTAPVMRAFIEKQLHNQSSIHKLFYIAPMFRYERQQAGRYRQHHQFGVEVIGVSAPQQDAEMIDLALSLYQRLGLKDLKASINSLGTPACRVKYRELLKDYLKIHFNELSVDSQTRFEVNPLRILDSKSPQDQAVVANAPSILDCLDAESVQHFDTVRRCLDALGIDYEVNSRLVRGLDYYNKTVFEVVSGQLGAQNSVCGGGRYDGLMKTLGGPDLPTLGFGSGLERVIQTMLKQGVSLPEKPVPDLFIIPMGEDALLKGVVLLKDLHRAGIPAQMDYSGRKIGKAMQYANQIGARHVLILGDQELASGRAELKQMDSGTTRPIDLNTLIQDFKSC